MKRKLPFGDYTLRVMASALMFVSTFVLLSGSTFAARMRNDIPPFVPGLDGPQGIAFVLAVVLAWGPLLFGRHHLRALMASAFAAAGIGAYWWTTIPWDELITDSGFPTHEPPVFLDYLLVATPVLVVGFYAAASQWSRLRADLLSRGAENAEATRAAATSFLSGAGLLVVCGALTALLWTLMASGAVFRLTAPLPQGVPALVMAAALLAVAYALVSDRVRLKRPSSGEARRGVLARIRGRRSPS